MEKTKEIIPGVTEATIQGWLAKMPNHTREDFRLLEIPRNEDQTEFLDAIGVVPDNQTLSEFEKWMDKNPLKAKEILINSCVKTSLDEIKGDKYLFQSAVTAIAELIPIRKVRIKKI